MNATNHKRQAGIRYLFALFGILAAIDIALISFSLPYRSAYGAVRSIPDVSWRIIPDVVMIFFYGLVFWKTTSGAVPPRLMVWHGILYSIVGIAMCIPWGGYFFAPFSPVGSLFLGSMLWVPSGYFLSLGVAILFIAFNLYLVWCGLRRRS